MPRFAYCIRMALYVAGWVSITALMISVIEWSVSLGATSPILSLFAMITASLVIALDSAIVVLAVMSEK